MAIQPTSIELEATPNPGVIFYSALDQLDDWTRELIANYPQIVTESEAVQGLVESQPFFHEEYEDLSGGKVIERYISNTIAVIKGGEKDRHLQEEMGWRNRLLEESARAVDTGEAIKRAIYGASLPRMFDGPHDPIERNNDFVSSLLERCNGQPRQIGAHFYGPMTLMTRNGEERSVFGRVDDEGAVVFGSLLIMDPDQLAGTREASADDCCQLIADIESTRATDYSH